MGSTTYLKPFRFRWDDLDPNRHVANFSYVKACVDLRMRLLEDNGIDQSYLMQNSLGFVSLSEESHFISEVIDKEQLYIDIELEAWSADKRFYRFAHHIYSSDGEIVFYMNTMLATMDISARKLVSPTAKIITLINNLPRSERYSTLDKSDLRKAYVPYDKTINIPDQMK